MQRVQLGSYPRHLDGAHNYHYATVVGLSFYNMSIKFEDILFIPRKNLRTYNIFFFVVLWVALTNHAIGMQQSINI